MNKLHSVLLGLWVFSLLVLGYFVYDYVQYRGQLVEQNEPQKVEAPPSDEEVPVIEEPVESEVVEAKEVVMELAMIGDVLLHKHLALYGDWMAAFEPVKPYLESPDFLIANQESPPTAPTYEISGYPRFSSPHTIIRDLQLVGVDYVNLANNHIVDKGEGGMKVVFDMLDSYQMPYVGAYHSQEDHASHRIVEKDGLKVGLLSYTYDTNGLYLPNGSPYIVNYIKMDQITAEVQVLKPHVDVVTVLMHWGTEYVTTHNSEQHELAQQLNAAGVDIVFGSHPHVLQPYEKLVNAEGQETHVFYSLGNFFATTSSSNESFIGAIGSMQIVKKGEEVTVQAPKVIATSMLKGADGKYIVYPLAQVEAQSVRNLAWVQEVLGPEVVVQ